MEKSSINEFASCASPEDLAAYIYGELSPSARDLFETHLADCDGCTSELAEISFARLNVYEWNRDEFAQMETPAIVIPYAEPASTISFLDQVRGFFTFPAQWAAAGAAFAVVAIVFGTWYLNPSETEVAGIEIPANKTVVEKPSLPADPDVVASDPRGNDKDAAKTAEPLVSPATKVSETPVERNAVKNVRAVPAKSIRKSDRVEKTVEARRQTAPRLNDFEDEDDDSLRLGDLLAEVDTRD